MLRYRPHFLKAGIEAGSGFGHKFSLVHGQSQ
jgi:hypothetical protein